MTVVLAWLRLELRRRWRSLVVLALLIAISTGTVLTTDADARRDATAVDRFLDAVHRRRQPATAAWVRLGPDEHRGSSRPVP